MEVQELDSQQEEKLYCLHCGREKNADGSCKCKSDGHECRCGGACGCGTH